MFWATVCLMASMASGNFWLLEYRVCGFERGEEEEMVEATVVRSANETGRERWSGSIVVNGDVVNGESFDADWPIRDVIAR